MMTLNDKEKIKDEYSTIQTFSDNLENTCIASRANEKLNRYINISPFDYNRVVLNDDEFENDYINASYVNVSYAKFNDFIMQSEIRIYYTYHRAIIIHASISHHKVQNPTRAMTSGEWHCSTNANQLLC